MPAHARLHRLPLLLAVAAALQACAPGAGPSAAAVPALRLGAAEAGASAALAQDQLLTVALEARASTGYGWYVDELDPSLLRLAGREQQGSGTLGGLDQQLLHFAGVARGRTALGLYHRRAWEPAGTGDQVYRLEVEVAGPYTGEYAGEQRVRPRAAAAAGPAVAAAALPASYSLCGSSADGYAACTPVKDQGSCGGCWAFATAAVFENLLHLAGAGDGPDLSEQYLISCNTDGWSCAGGYQAFAYYVDAWRSPPETAAGAVYEADLPFTGGQACGSTPHPHHERLEGHARVVGLTPAARVAAIKQAIADHGPVWATVCADAAFSAWRPAGGPFSGSACGTVNHAVVLVGWDDNGGDGYWLMRNSWGADWGDHGYMRIAWDANLIAEDAFYALYGVVNRAPAASAGAAQAVDEGLAVLLDGSASQDPDGTIASWAWVQTSGPAVALGGADGAQATFTAPAVSSDLVLGFRLTVTDARGAQSSASTAVTVRDVEPPGASPGGVSGGCQGGGAGPAAAWGLLLGLALLARRRGPAAAPALTRRAARATPAR